jgi:predicted Zn-dependent protease with MMP-like domain
MAGMTAPTLDHFLSVARRVVDTLPEPFRPHARAVRLFVAEMPEDDMLRDLGMEDPLELTGLYEGVPLTEKHLWDPGTEPDTVWLFRAPILAEWRDRGDVELDDLIAHVTVHEFAHHFGWSDEDIATIDRWWE